MAGDFSICLGTAGWGVWHSADGGESWVRHRSPLPFPLNSRTQALLVHPSQPRRVLAAGDTGLFVSEDAGANWETIRSPLDIPTIWSLTPHPDDARVLYAGTRPAGVYRSRDGGERWEQLPVGIPPECPIGTPFVTTIVIDPDDPRRILAGVEVDGVYRSVDGGDSWQHLGGGLHEPDLHWMTIARTRPLRVFASTNREMFVSEDLGDRWKPLGIRGVWPLPYARGLAVKADDPTVLFAGCGETTTGATGHILRTRDFGRSWEQLPLPVRANSTIWGFATHPANADRILAFSLFGEVYLSEDAGDSWRKLEREFGEIRTAAWMPN